MADTHSRPQRRRWIVRGFLIFLAVVALGAFAQWRRLCAEVDAGKEELAAALAEADEQGLRWQWEHLEEDRPKVPETENGIRIVREVWKALGGKVPPPIRAADGEEVKFTGPA